MRPLYLEVSQCPVEDTHGADDVDDSGETEYDGASAFSVCELCGVPDGAYEGSTNGLGDPILCNCSD